jgi:hypothetical protein
LMKVSNRSIAKLIILNLRLAAFWSIFFPSTDLPFPLIYQAFPIPPRGPVNRGSTVRTSWIYRRFKNIALPERTHSTRHFCCSVSFPLQGFPFSEGAGFVQVLDRVWTPFPQSPSLNSRHSDQSPKSVQPPFILSVKLNSMWDYILKGGNRINLTQIF